MSSRNAYLGDEDRRRAATLRRALRAAESSVAGGERSVEAVLAAARAELDADGIDPEYLEARDAETLAPIESFNGRAAVIALAARVGPARLIDNVVIGD
jgi:pantoate--beta-alanine ligase